MRSDYSNRFGHISLWFANQTTGYRLDSGTIDAKLVDDKLMIRSNIDRQKILVAVANHGEKNMHFLETVLAEYQSMKSYEVKVVVLSNVPKCFGQGVEVNIGMPTKDPWSLPFAYKTLFSRLRNDYDLFIYTEDDILITERNIDSFLEVTAVLSDEYIAGFVRYEMLSNGNKSFPDMHSHFHWDSTSVIRVADLTFAHHTNQHSGCFILTRKQLRKAINLGGFMLPPRRGPYDMLVTAATEPYTNCGAKKVICISRLDDFSVHHLPNVYCGRVGIEEEHSALEVMRLGLLADGEYHALRAPLFVPYPLWDADDWNKKYYERRRNDVLECIPEDACDVLSIGCGCGTTEEVLVGRGMKVVGVPLDFVISASGSMKGIEMLPPDFDVAASKLQGRQFDCILVLDILQQIQDPVAVIMAFSKFLRKGGMILISVPNWNYIGTLKRRLSPHAREAFKCRDLTSKNGVHRTTSGLVGKWVRASGLDLVSQRGIRNGRHVMVSGGTLRFASQFLSRTIITIGQR